MAGEKMQELIVEVGTSEGKIIEEFKKLARRRHTSQTRG
jgi:hypothetical protein